MTRNTMTWVLYAVMALLTFYIAGREFGQAGMALTAKSALAALGGLVLGISATFGFG